MHRFKNLFLPRHWTTPEFSLSLNWWILQKLLWPSIFDLHRLWNRFNAWQVGKSFSLPARYFLRISRCCWLFLRLSLIFFCFSRRRLRTSCNFLPLFTPWRPWICCSEDFLGFFFMLHSSFFGNPWKKKQLCCFFNAFFRSLPKIARRTFEEERRLGINFNFRSQSPRIF